VVAASTIVLVRGTKELIESVRGRTTVGLRVKSASFEDHLIIVSRIVRVGPCSAWSRLILMCCCATSASSRRNKGSPRQHDRRTTRNHVRRGCCHLEVKHQVSDWTDASAAPPEPSTEPKVVSFVRPRDDVLPARSQGANVGTIRSHLNGSGVATEWRNCLTSRIAEQAPI
jgi:hypothetical protein